MFEAPLTIKVNKLLTRNMKSIGFSKTDDRFAYSRKSSFDNIWYIIGINSFGDYAEFSFGITFKIVNDIVGSALYGRKIPTFLRNPYKSVWLSLFLESIRNFTDNISNDNNALTSEEVDAALRKAEPLSSLKKSLEYTIDRNLFNGNSLYTLPAAALLSCPEKYDNVVRIFYQGMSNEQRIDYIDALSLINTAYRDIDSRNF